MLCPCWVFHVYPVVDQFPAHFLVDQFSTHFCIFSWGLSVKTSNRFLLLTGNHITLHHFSFWFNVFFDTVLGNDMIFLTNVLLAVSSLNIFWTKLLIRISHFQVTFAGFWVFHTLCALFDFRVPLFCCWFVFYGDYLGLSLLILFVVSVRCFWRANVQRITVGDLFGLSPCAIVFNEWQYFI